MADIEVYGFENADGSEEVWTTMDIHEAREHAAKHSLRLIGYLYEFTDSELIADYTEDLCDQCNEPIEKVANGWTHSEGTWTLFEGADLDNDHEPRKSIDTRWLGV